MSEILARTEKLSKAEVGLTKATINCHMNNMTNIAGMCQAYGYLWESYDGISKLRAKRSEDPENERPSFTTGDLQALFSLPIWTGAAKGGIDGNPGGEVFHDARYQIPLIGALEGARREEIYGFRLDEIIEFEVFAGSSLSHRRGADLSRKRRNETFPFTLNSSGLVSSSMSRH